MTNMLRISDAASLALHTMAYLAGNTDRLVSTHEIASALNISENHLAKVHQWLAKAGLVDAVRGPSGGSRITKSPRDITLLDIYEAVEGPFKPANCLLHRPACPGKNCILGGLVASVNTQVRDFLAGTTLEQLANPNGGA